MAGGGGGGSDKREVAVGRTGEARSEAMMEG
jgi:hypothetical protein